MIASACARRGRHRHGDWRAAPDVRPRRDAARLRLRARHHRPVRHRRDHASMEERHRLRRASTRESNPKVVLETVEEAAEVLGDVGAQRDHRLLDGRPARTAPPPRRSWATAWPPDIAKVATSSAPARSRASWAPQTAAHAAGIGALAADARARHPGLADHRGAARRPARSGVCSPARCSSSSIRTSSGD